MKAALLLKPENVEIGEVADPVPAPDDVAIQPDLVGICGTDVSFYLGHRSVPYPFVLGHEMIGRIRSLGGNVKGLAVGQRVIVEPNYPCGSCAYCLSGRGAICPNKRSMGVNEPGCLSEYALAPGEFVWPLPDSISDQDAVTIEPLAVSLHGLLSSGVKSGDTVSVLGCGVVGLLLIHAAKSIGVRVIAHDRLAPKLELARKLGADIACELENASGLWQKENVVAVFECAGSSATLECAVNAAPRGSLIVLLGISSSKVSFIPMRLVREGVNIRTSMIYDHPVDFKHAIDLVAQGKLNPACVVTDTFSFQSVGEALRLASGGSAGKIHIKMH
jgi:2-desacetyl-2-hydroxyethyl bacteriochlorophyllide A dehydrogenase